MFYDYLTNLPLYPVIQAYFRERQPRRYLEVLEKNRPGTCPSPGSSAAPALAVSLHSSASRISAKRGNAFDQTIRLDLTQNPYGLCPAAIEALRRARRSHLIAHRHFRRRLNQVYRVPVVRFISSEASMGRSVASFAATPARRSPFRPRPRRI